jgi:hypothetical protein
MFMRYYGGGVGHVDPTRGIEAAEVDPAEVGDEGQCPDPHDFDDAEEPDSTGDEGDDGSDSGENSDEEDVNI